MIIHDNEIYPIARRMRNIAVLIGIALAIGTTIKAHAFPDPLEIGLEREMFEYHMDAYERAAIKESQDRYERGIADSNDIKDLERFYQREFEREHGYTLGDVDRDRDRDRESGTYSTERCGWERDS